MSRSAEHLLETTSDAAAKSPSTGVRSAAVLVGLVVAAFLAARWCGWVPLWVGVAALALSAMLLHPKLVLIAVLAVIGARSGGAVAALVPLESSPIERAHVRLVDDPRPDGVSWRVQLDLDGNRVLATVRNPEAGELRNASAGGEAVVTGTLRGMTSPTSWTISNRLVGRLSISEIEIVKPAGGPTGAANTLRDTIRSGASHMSSTRRVLFTGLVFGDDRGQDAVVADNFRAAGLGHLLAVSGQNVVFVLLLASPVLQRIRSIPLRFAASSVVLLAFGFATRFEPSVTRALVMAFLVLAAIAVGRPAAAPVVLAPAIWGLLLLDPLLAWSLAFQLSVAATLGLVVFTPWIVDHLRGPDPIRLPIAATIAAQLAVSPLLFATFGFMSVVAVPANLLAAPAAAGVMMWGLVAGVIAGIGPPATAQVIHLPTEAMIWWIDGVAAVFARVDVGQLTPWHVVASIGGVLLLRSDGPLRVLAVAALLGGVVVPVVAPAPLEVGHHAVVDGVEVHRSEGGIDVVVLGGQARVSDTLEALRRANLGRIDALIVLDGGRAMGRLVYTIDTRFDIVDIWAPAGHQVPRARTMRGDTLVVGELEVARNGSDVLVRRVQAGDPLTFRPNG